MGSGLHILILNQKCGEKKMLNSYNGYNKLGFNSPYFFKRNNKLIIKGSFQEIINDYATELHPDPTAIVELLSNNYFFADRTIIKGISKSPWMAKPNDKLNDWVFEDIPEKKYRFLSEKEIADKLFELLVSELIEYCQDKSTVGILLSGGMDSRVVAGLLDYLKREKIININVVAVTWGLEDSRDVEYARIIASKLGFMWEHFSLSSEDLKNNVGLTVQRGCEYSPIHLHAMPRIKQMNGIDCFLGGIYGDSIGRGVYSGRHINKLRPINETIHNYFNFMRHDIYKETLKDIKEDIEFYYKRFPRTNLFQKLEIQQQAHYLRKMLNPAMAIINERIPVHQLFANEQIYNFVWSLHPDTRNNKVYSHLFNKINRALLEIPWAKTGKYYLSNEGPRDKYKEIYQNYNEWIRVDLYDTIRENILSDSLLKLNIFNEYALETTLKLIKISKRFENPKLMQVLLWLTSLAKLINGQNLKSIGRNSVVKDEIFGKIITPLSIINTLTKKAISKKINAYKNR